ncbi:MAG: ABC transporter permease [Bacteroidota bacterium]|nr:ABC transporter permease [Bacteroidota bacterium]
MLLGKLIKESFLSAFGSLIVNKLRTVLSLLGITIGIFAIISVLTIIDSLERYIRNSLQSLGDNIVYVQKWPWMPPPGEKEYPWWKYLNRPVPRPSEADELHRRSQSAEYVIFFAGITQQVQYQKNSVDNTQIIGSDYDLPAVWDLQIDQGRYFTETEAVMGKNIAILGDELANKLFEGSSPLGKSIKVKGNKVTVVGTFKKKGNDMFGTSMDKRVLLPLGFFSRLADLQSNDNGQTIIIKAREGITSTELSDELKSIMRAIRRIKPLDDDNFALNEVNLISTRFDAFFTSFTLAGWIIGGFSILVGAFGIANIMFVSVKERTKLIGIQKALGAKRRFILMEFLFESVVLSLIGGVIGLILIFIGTLIVQMTSDLHIIMSIGNIMTGIIISGTIGLLAGLIPAVSASRLDPIEAMNTL